jgi:uncharacterized protein
LAKIILVVLGLLLVYYVLKGYRRRVERPDQRPRPGEGEDMVQCAQCGVHLPRGESFAAQGRYYCSAEHQRAHLPERHSS